MFRPPPLHPGDRIAVVAPSSPFDRERFDRGLERLARRYTPVLDPHVFDAERYLAGSDSVRAGSLHRALVDPGVQAVFCARGGSGAGRLLPLLDLEAVPPRLLVGFSDATSLHAALQSRGRTSVHAPVVTQLADQPESVLDRLFQLLEGGLPGPLAGATPLVPGVAEGPLLGGNLAVLVTLLGTPWLPDTRGAVLLLEDDGEQPYRLDRMWTHLRNAGVFAGLGGIALGDFTQCERPGADFTARDVLRSLAEETALPCAVGFPVGHGPVNMPLALGTRVRLDAGAGTLTPLEAATR
ncbi:MAG TPA: LD-carboxypeptidase [Myxococcaceae bacterium]|nr:LD-carboxypeptidase [Myxococcaceae bacterium]